MSPLMSLADVADYLKKPKGWVYENWMRLGIPFRKVGNQLRCRPRDLENWLDSKAS